MSEKIKPANSFLKNDLWLSEESKIIKKNNDVFENVDCLISSWVKVNFIIGCLAEGSLMIQT